MIFALAACYMSDPVKFCRMFWMLSVAATYQIDSYPDTEKEQP